MKYSIFDVAEWFLQKKPMTHKKIQKMCFYAQAWSYALLDEPLTDSDFQAWIHGPVSPDLYQKYKGNGWKDIQPENTVLKFDKKAIDLLESVYLTYGDISGNELEALTHNELPWQKARLGLDESENSTVVISPEDMKNFYKSIYIGSEA